mgnify:CR=1 FL=1
MITIPGQLAIKTIHGRNGDFNVGRLATSIGEFVVKNAELDQYTEGKYEGDFVIAEIRPSTYNANGRMVIEIRAHLGGMTLSNIDALSRDEARRLSPQEVDPIDEEAQTPAPASPPAKPKAKSRSPRDPLVDTTPFGSEPAPASAAASAEADDAALFASLWPLGETVKLDATVDRRVLRQQRDRLDKLVFKKYPSCGLTLGSTDVILSLMREADGRGVSADNVERVKLKVPPYTYKLVGHPFEMGATPRVNAQFSIRYCVANALLRGSSKLAHFEEEAIRDPRVLELARRVDVVVDPAMELRGHTPVDMTVTLKDGRELFRQIDIAPGFPGNPLTKEEQEARFRDCIAYAKKPLPKEKVEWIVERVARIDNLSDIRILIPLLLL